MSKFAGSKGAPILAILVLIVTAGARPVQADYTTGSRPPLKAAIVAADGTNLILNKGAADGVTIGQFFGTSHRVSKTDPVSGKTLVSEVPDGRLQIISVSAKTSVARRVSGASVVGGIARS